MKNKDDVVLMVTKLPDQKYVKSNVVVCNPKQFSKKSDLVLIDNLLCVKLALDEAIPLGKIGLSAQIRTKNVLSFTSSVKVEPYLEKLGEVISLDLELISFNPKIEIFCSDVQILESIKTRYDHQMMAQDGYYHLMIDKTDVFLFVKKVQVSDGEHGIFTSSTVITDISSDSIIISSKKSRLPLKFFKDGFDFSTIGVGGLDQQLSDVFRRAFGTRGISSQKIEKLGIKHEKGVLLEGPSGTGKTTIARAIAGHLTGKPVKIINGPQILDRFVQVVVNRDVRDIFKDAIEGQKKKDGELYVIIIDECECIFGKRGSSSTRGGVNDSVVNQFLSMIDGPESLDNIIIIAMTNRKDMIDDAIIRQGRIGIHIYVGLPDLKGRRQIFNIHTKKMGENHMMSRDVDLEELCRMTESYTGSEIEAVVKNACSKAIKKVLEDMKDGDQEPEFVVTQEDFLSALTEVIPSFGRSVKFDKIIPADNRSLTTYDLMKTKLLNPVPNRVSSVLIYGAPEFGKSTFMVRYAQEMNFRFVKYISVGELVEMSETQRSSHLLKIVYDASLTLDSCVIIDDLEIVMDYVDFAGIRFSNKIYQTILSILKTILTDRRMVLLCSTSEMDLYQKMKTYFRDSYILE